MNKDIPKSLADLKAEKKRLKAEAQQVLLDIKPVQVANDVISDYDIDMLFDLGSLLFYPKKARNMKIVSIAIPVLIVTVTKAFGYLKDNEVVKDLMNKAEEALKSKKAAV